MSDKILFYVRLSESEVRLVKAKMKQEKSDDIEDFLAQAAVAYSKPKRTPVRKPKTAPEPQE